ncbi:MAG: helix-turn-helix domain-containing protein [Bacillota bacterium]
MDIGARIKQLREELGLSQNELARRAGIAQSSLSYLESGAKSPSVDTLLLICKALGVSLTEFLGETGGNSAPEHIKPLLDRVRHLTPEQVQKLAEFIKSLKA